jgi:hypothetical protein
VAQSRSLTLLYSWEGQHRLESPVVTHRRLDPFNHFLLVTEDL